MIVFDLACDARHRFEGWFRSSADFDAQRARGLLSCPVCGCGTVSKAPMAPAVPAKGNRVAVAALPSANRPPDGLPSRPVSTAPNVAPEIALALANLAAAQAKALATSRWVGDDFAKRSRAMYYGEVAEEQIHGRATGEEAKALIEEGVAVLPLLVPVVPPDETN